MSYDTWIYPRLAVVPMGWAHAAWFCQLIHMTVVRSSQFTNDASYMHDNIPVPPMSTGAHTEYLDNFSAFGTAETDVREATEDAVRALTDKGLEVHEVQIADSFAAILGWEIDGEDGWISPGKFRRWRLRLAIDHLLLHPVVTGIGISRLIGHYTFMAMICRPALSVCHALYAFVERFSDRPARLWPACIRELRWMRSLLPLLRRDLFALWSPWVVATDASEWGLGATRTSMPVELVGQTGRIRERWRWKCGDMASACPRSAAALRDARVIAVS